MKYLFFDEEFATSKGGICKICEFGYVVTDENYTILEKGNLIINPNIDRSEWDWRVVKTILTRKIYEYEHSSTFLAFYDKIKALIESADFIGGHTIAADAKALNDECKRYNLPCLEYSFLDIMKIYKALTGKRLSVFGMSEVLGITVEGKEHDAEGDALHTAMLFQNVFAQNNLTMESATAFPDAMDSNKDYEVLSLLLSHKRKEERMKKADKNTLHKHDENRILFLQFLDNVQPISQGSKLAGKKVSISMNYEEFHFKQMMNLVQYIANEGGQYILKSSTADVFVTYDAQNEDGSIRRCTRRTYVEDANANGANIQIITLTQFLELLGITEQELDNMPLPDLDCLKREDAIITSKKYGMQAPKRTKEEDKQIHATIGDLIGDLIKTFGTDSIA